MPSTNQKALSASYARMKMKISATYRNTRWAFCRMSGR
jgi:hypothetical protein